MILFIIQDISSLITNVIQQNLIEIFIKFRVIFFESLRLKSNHLIESNLILRHQTNNTVNQRRFNVVFIIEQITPFQIHICLKYLILSVHNTVNHPCDFPNPANKVSHLICNHPINTINQNKHEQGTDPSQIPLISQKLDLIGVNR